MERLIKAFFYSIDGFKQAFKDEAAFREEIYAGIVLFPLAWFLAETPVELVLMWFSLMFVLAMELVNSAIEAAIDRVGHEVHPLSKKAKDIGSAVVLVALINVVLVWGVILLS